MNTDRYHYRPSDLLNIFHDSSVQPTATLCSVEIPESNLTIGGTLIGIEGCLERIIGIPGAIGVTLVDGASGLAIAAAGRHGRLDEHENAAATTDVVRAVLECPALADGHDDDITELVVCGPRGYHLLNLVEGDFEGRLFVHVRFDDETGNLAMARFRLRGILAELTGHEC